MQLPYFSQRPSFDVLPSYRFHQFYEEPEPPLTFLLGYFDPNGLNLQLRAYEPPNFHSYFCFTLLSGRKLCFSKNIFPGRPDPTLSSIPIEGENLIGHYWGCQLFIPKQLCPSPISGIIGLFHDNIPLCFLNDGENHSPSYPQISFTPEPHPVPSSEEIPAKNR